MDYKVLRDELAEYVELISKIRVLSAVQIEEGIEAKGYSICLRKDYREIGAIGQRSRQILQETIYPLLEQKGPIEFEVLEILQNFCNMLLEPASGEELDLLLLFEISSRLIGEFRAAGDVNAYVKQLHIHINVCYANVNRTARVSVSRELTTFYRDQGLIAAQEIRGYVYDKEQFVRLDNASRHAAIRGVRFYSALYDTFYAEEQSNIERFQALKDALSLLEDPFYRENIENYNWVLHRCRCIEHMGQLTERGNRWKFSREQCGEICEWLKVLEQMWEDNVEELRQILPEFHYRLILLRNAYFAGKKDKKEYQEELLRMYECYANDSYDMYAVQMNLLIPAEYLSTFRGETRLSARAETVIHRIYNQVIDYLYNSVNMDAFNYLQEYLVAFLDEFIEIPGEMNFEDMVLHCLAALHPPTYVHCVQVADISKCLAEHLMEARPELFVEAGFAVCEEEIDAAREEILRFIYHSALCHDFGKITMIDTIFVYGRKLLDSEFGIIKMHPAMGAELLSRYRSTEKYAEIAGQHHLWFNGEGGYPRGEGRKPSVFANIVEVADCIDAATDTIGRSYSNGKKLEELCAELYRDAGTHYAPYVVELLKNEEVVEDVDHLLTFGRDNNYQKTYLLLNRVRQSL